MRLKLLFILAALVAANSAGAQTFTSVYLNNPVLQSGTANMPGAIYKYANAAGGNGNLIDAYIRVVKTSNVNTSTTSTDIDSVGLFAFDNAASVNNPGGFDSSFQPVVSSSNVNASGLWTAGNCGQGTVEMSYRPNQNYLVHFRIYFKKAGTNTDTALNVKAAFIDIDGFGSGTEAEQNAFMPGASYATDGSTTLTLTTRPDGLLNAEGQPGNVGGIQFTTTSAIVQVTYLNRTFVDFGIGMNTHAANLSGSCYTAVSGGRLASVSFGTQPTGLTTVASTSVSLSGTVWNDADGSANNTFSNIRTNAEPGANDSTLFVYAIDSATGAVIGKSSVASTGTWSINNIPGSFAVKLQLSKDNVSVGVTNGGPGSALNAGWVAMSPLARPAFRPLGNTTGLDFGIEQIPVAGAGTNTSANPGGTQLLTVPANAFSSTAASTDQSPGAVTGILITAIPAGATTITINGITYGPGNTAFPAAGVSVPVNASAQPNQTIMVNPAANGATTVDISFKAVDVVGKTSANTGHAILSLTDLTISGKVYDDANGQTDALINGSLISSTNSQPLYANLVNRASGLVVGKATVASGSYTLAEANGVQANTAFNVVLSTVPGVVGTTNGATAVLSSNWVSTAEGAAIGDGTPNGLVAVNTVASNISTGADFGIEQLPTAGSGTYMAHNPGGTVQATVPATAFSSTTASSDPLPGAVTGILITSIPAGATTIAINGVTYGTGFTAFPATGISVPANASGQPAQTIKADPTLSTATTVDISFKAVDAAGKTSTNTGHAVISMIDPVISGKVYDDADGQTDGLIDGTLISSTGSQSLYVNLVNSSGNVLASTAVVGGSYTFTQANGVVANTAYSVVLSTVQGFNGTSIGATSAIPAGWAYTADGSGIGDGTPNGLVALITGTAITSANFGIEQLPTAYDDTAARQLNPGGTTQIPVPASVFSGTDPEDGIYDHNLDGSTVTLIPGANGNLYYDKNLVTGPITISQFKSSKVTIDPTGSDPAGWIPVTSTFSYSVYDGANKPSPTKTIYVPFDLLTLKLRVYLEGALINNGNAVASDGRPLMRDGLRSSPFTGENSLPSADPYTTSTLFVNVTGKSKKLAPQTTYAQFQHVTDSATVFSVTGQNAIVDWVYVELRDKHNKTNVVAVRSGLLQRDGDVVDVDGVSGLKFPDVPIDSYYVTVDHRTHLGTMVKYAQSAANLQSLVDFTVTTTPLYDNGIVGGFNYTGLSQKANVKGTYRAMWQGDFNGDGKIKYDGLGDDLSILPFDVKHHPKNTKQESNNDFSYGYRQGDYDMNGKVKSDNPNDDNALLLFQVRRYPLNVNNTTSFDYILQQLP